MTKYMFNGWVRATLVFACNAVLICENSSLAAEPSLSVGIGSAFGVSTNGDVVSWGGNFDSQLGIAKRYVSGEPGTIRNLPKLTSAAVGSDHSLVISDAGQVYAWGQNPLGALGVGDTKDRIIPASVPALGRLISISAGGLHSLAVGIDGGILSWGGNLFGALAKDPGLVDMQTTPIAVAGPVNMQAVAAGDLHSLSLDQGGRVWSWGYNGQGQLGNGNFSNTFVPAMVGGLPLIKKIRAGQFNSFAITTEGTLWGWGHNAYGQMGVDPALASSAAVVYLSTPVLIAGAPKIQDIAPGEDHVLALDLSGAVWSWGTNYRGGLGRGPIGTSADFKPQRVPLPAPIVSIAVGFRVSFAVDIDGNVWGWGSSENDLLGPNMSDSSFPIKIAGLPRITQIVASRHRLIALDSSGGPWSLGTYSNGQLGSEVLPIENTPIPVSSLSSIQSIAAGGLHALGLNAEGEVFAWGSNRNTNLAVASYIIERSATPRRVAGLPRIASIAAGAVTSYALDQSCTPFTWGDNSMGQLGLGPNVPSRDVPTPIQGICLSQISAGSRHALGKDKSGSVWAWGSNSSGQLGSQSGICFGGQSGRICATSPVKLPGVENAIKVSAGFDHSIVLLADGSLVAAGSNQHGQLGASTVESAGSFTPVRSDARFVDAAAGARFSIALDETGAVWTWGKNDYGQLGQGISSASNARPALVGGLPRIRSIAAGSDSDSAFAIAVDGTVWAWGRNEAGTLGDGTFIQRNSPVLVINPNVQGFLDLDINTKNDIPSAAIPPFLVKSTRKGDNRFYSFSVDVRGVLDLSAIAARSNSISATAYNLYVVARTDTAGVVTLFQLNSNAHWESLSSPIASYISGVQLSSLYDTILVQIFENVDVSEFVGTQVFLGYGRDPDEMILAGRFRQIMSISE